jgi:hypothetical protein
MMLSERFILAHDFEVQQPPLPRQLCPGGQNLAARPGKPVRQPTRAFNVTKKASPSGNTISRVAFFFDCAAKPDASSGNIQQGDSDD